MSEIFSYYSKSDEKIVKETLNEHISEALKVVEGINESKISKYMCNIFPRMKNFSDIVRLTVIFHDIGKVFYQRNIDEIIEYIPFFGHEFFSAYMFKKFYWCSKKMLDSEEIFGVDVKYPIMFAIIFHHHAMDITKREEFLKQEHTNIQRGINLFNVLLKSIEPFLNDEDKIPFIKSLSIIRENFENKDLIISGIKRESVNTLADLWKVVWLDSNKKKFSLILLDTLLVADNIAAKNKRGHSTSTFIQALMDFHDSFISRPAEQIL